MAARLVMRGVHKRFGATRALRGASLELLRGEVHALLGENGAGKSTLVGVLFGLVRPDQGEILLDGKPVSIRGPAEALALGIGLVSQHPWIIPALSVAENFALGAVGRRWLPRRRLRDWSAHRLAQHGVALDPDRPAGELPLGLQQRLEIARSLERGAEILILDEPSAALAPAEVDALLALLARLRDQGRTIVFISHKLREIEQVGDRITVLRAGETVATREAAGASAAEIAQLMVGEELPPEGAPPECAQGEVALRLQSVHAQGLRDLSLELRSGQILGLAGIDGNGQAELEALLCGVLPLRSGRVDLALPPLAVLSGDRRRTGLVLDLSLAENLILPDAASGGRPPAFSSGILRPLALYALAEQAIERFAIRATASALVRTLSGGNQQKILVARALRADPRVLVAVNPTRGLDVAATRFVREELRARARAGGAVLLVSTDLDEVLELSHRIAVLFRGSLFVPESARPTRARIGELMLGGDFA